MQTMGCGASAKKAYAKVEGAVEAATGIDLPDAAGMDKLKDAAKSGDLGKIKDAAADAAPEGALDKVQDVVGDKVDLSKVEDMAAKSQEMAAIAKDAAGKLNVADLKDAATSGDLSKVKDAAGDVAAVVPQGALDKVKEVAGDKVDLSKVEAMAEQATDAAYQAKDAAGDAAEQAKEAAAKAKAEADAAAATAAAEAEKAKEVAGDAYAEVPAPA